MIVAVVAGDRVIPRGRSGALNRNSEAGNQAEQWGVRIGAPAKGPASPQIRELLGKALPIAYPIARSASPNGSVA